MAITRANLLALQAGDRVFADRYTDYAKVLTADAIPTPSAREAESASPIAVAWDVPQTLPAPDAARISAEIGAGQWSAEQTAMAQQKLIALLVVLIWPIGILTGIYEDELSALEGGLHDLWPGWIGLGFLAFVAMVIGLYVAFAERVALWLTRLGDWFLRKGL